MNSDIKPKLRAIFRKSEDRLGSKDSLGNPDLVPFCHDIVRIYNLSDTNKEEFEHVFIEDFDIFNECPWELTQLCMHHLKLSKYRTHLETKLKEAKCKSDWRAIPVINHILDSYQDNWDDKELFYGKCS